MKKEYKQHKEMTKRLEKFTKNGERIILKTLLKEEKNGYLPSINVKISSNLFSLTQIAK